MMEEYWCTGVLMSGSATAASESIIYTVEVV
jgi:hypothetical protein